MFLLLPFYFVFPEISLGHASTSRGAAPLVTRVAGTRSRSLRCRLRQPFEDAGGAATSPTVGCAAPSESTMSMMLHALLTATVCRLSSMSSRHAPYPNRSGRSMVYRVARDLTIHARDNLTWLVSHALDVCVSHTSAAMVINLCQELARLAERVLRTSAQWMARRW